MIRVLDKKVTDKIAAGEVIDRPVSIVKELLENSIDAGADNITVEIREGGKSYIRITDNGCGIEADEVEVAFRRHATSKIISEKDLDSIHTLGFRGEALASICAVARVEVITKTADASTGRKVLCEGSEILENSPIGCPDGTTITVRDLFYNVPARQKFMATDASEARRIIDLVSRLALSYADIKFRLINNGKNIFTTSGKGNILHNIMNIYGADLGKDLLPVEGKRGGFAIKGFVSGPGTSLPTRSRQIFCVNGRIISSHVLEQALSKAYAERLFAGRYPIAFLFLAVPPEKMDVNIHPTKKEVRFDDNFEVEDFVADAVREALKAKDAIPEVREEMVLPEMQSIFMEKTPAKAAAREEKEPLQKPEASVQEEMASFETAPARESGKPDQGEQVDIKNILTTLRAEQEALPEIKEQTQKPFEFDDLVVRGIIFNTYIMATDADTFFLIDQHAAHERIYYEKFRNQYESGEKNSQQLLIPLRFHVPADVSASEESWIDEVRRLGYDIELFGTSIYIVREIPAFLDITSAEAFLNDLFNQLQEKPNLVNSRVLDKIISRSCKAAVKGGDVLQMEEVDALMRQLAACNNPFSCPHGRPTFIKLTKHEIERMFKRV